MLLISVISEIKLIVVQVLELFVNFQDCFSTVRIVLPPESIVVFSNSNKKIKVLFRVIFI